MTRLFQDLRFAIHSLRRDRRFTLLAVLALALGIGSVTVIFSAVYGVLIDTFPYAHYDRTVSFSIDEPGQQGLGRELLTIPEFLDFRDQNHVFEDMEGGTGGPVHYIHGDQTTQWTVTRARIVIPAIVQGIVLQSIVPDAVRTAFNLICVRLGQ